MNLGHFLKHHVPSVPLNDALLSSLSGVLTTDSRTVKPGDVFLALPLLSGATNESYIQEAKERGAALVLSVPEGRRILASWAKYCYGRQPEKCVAVTGTNGKSSVADFTRQIWESAGIKAASMGTLGLRSDSCDISRFPAVSLTSPDPLTLHQCLDALAQEDVQHVALEASSHGLDQYRLDEVQLAAAAFTNLTHEHLDYHKTMEAYFKAKARLFTEILPPSGIAVLNKDDPYGQEIGKMCRAQEKDILWFGSAKADILVEKVQASPQGLSLAIRAFGNILPVELPLIGLFQVENILAALGLVIGAGMEPQQALKGVMSLKSVPGRMEFVGQTPSGGQVFVDYAHKPHALEKALNSLRAHGTQRLLVVVGCGGDRDREKRPMMGAIAARWADEVIITDDNPRQEDSGKIRAEILQGCPEGIEIASRREAIAYGIRRLSQGAVCLIAGKGHEQGQIMGAEVFPFDDRQVAREILQTQRQETRA